uniref:C2H2-type domain-containing protein n=1 Tax=Ditylenchus dipsaci TaxID=166011 RepID=A0A915DU46_9BILA
MRVLPPLFRRQKQSKSTCANPVAKEKRFVCSNCGRRFAVKSYLSKHEESACGQHQSTTPGKETVTSKRGRSATSHMDNNNNS